MPATVVTVPDVPSRWKLRASRAPRLLGKGGERLRAILDHLLEQFAADLDAAIALGDRDDADRQRSPFADAGGEVARFAAAADQTISVEPPPI